MKIQIQFKKTGSEEIFTKEVEGELVGDEIKVPVTNDGDSDITIISVELK